MNFSEEFLLTLFTDLKYYLKSSKKCEEINHIFQSKTKISNFFHDKKEIEHFLERIKKHLATLKQKKKKKKKPKADMGDFQTPIHLTNKICKYLIENGENPTLIIEPTCGKGNFILSALNYFPNLEYIYCVELQKKYEWDFKLNILHYAILNPIHPIIDFYCDNIFHHSLTTNIKKNIHSESKILIIGNPPWITNSELSSLRSQNIPKKSNKIKQFRGIDSITGKSNFDIAEFIINDLVQKLTKEKLKGNTAILCKNTVIRNFVKNNRLKTQKISNIKAVEIDAKKEFNIHAAAALFYSSFGETAENKGRIQHIDKTVEETSSSEFGWVNNKFVSNICQYSKYAYFDGIFYPAWRQGVKHDLTKIMVLKQINSTSRLYENGLNQTIALEQEKIYPFLKSSDLKKKLITSTRYQVIITQEKVGQSTDYLKTDFPQLYNYLNIHREKFQNRKSKIYVNKPVFSIFGIGDYSFKPYKIGISGFYKDLHFSLIPPQNNKPVILDDTCYFISFDDYDEAFYYWIVLNLPEIKKFLQSITFLDAKRPYTKEILMRIDLSKLIKQTKYRQIEDYYQKTLRNIIDRDISEQNFIQFLNKREREKKEKLKKI
ncbi:hypothetical protein NEF87_003772 [Candidatus Lokiarchaeum ossiferum]|uniref:Uncharacterized protein n=1 Tax=Candidatus Lokiarchaeum ossiferum TaxID=2951803 RepID=A0ABY6HXB5_9ARCH|nr:hypothetical protein NEF87_003772 [Candidatus Lokiarchaeum sp. B-35]